MNEKRNIGAERRELELGAMAIRHHGDAILDGSHAVKGMPETYGYTFLALAGWLETEAQIINSRTRPYALAIVRSFVHGSEAVL